jgi:hypothetical protein
MTADFFKAKINREKNALEKSRGEPRRVHQKEKEARLCFLFLQIRKNATRESNPRPKIPLEKVKKRRAKPVL